MSLAVAGVLAMVLVGALIAAIGLSLMTDFRGSATWWRESVAEFRGIPPDSVFGGIPEKTMRLVVGGAFVAAGTLTFAIAAAHI